jgi:hypothetical protein
LILGGGGEDDEGLEEERRRGFGPEKWWRLADGWDCRKGEMDGSDVFTRVVNGGPAGSDVGGETAIAESSREVR